MKKNILLLSLFFVFIGCNSSDDNGNDQITIGEVLFDFSLQNSDGVDLLDPSLDGTFNTSSILLYEEVDGEYILFDDPLSAYPKGYTIDMRDGVNYFNPFYFDTNAPTHDLKIDWGNGIIDYIMVECEDDGGKVKYATNITYNSNLVWNRTINPEGLYFTVIMD
jgi:hypothetical protein